MKFTYCLKVSYTVEIYVEVEEMMTFYGCFLPESFKSQPVQQALIQSFCQNHNKAIESLRKATATQPEPSMFVLLGKIQMKAEKTKVRNVYIIYIYLYTYAKQDNFFLNSFNIL